jgi:hypothetical protein
MANIEKLHIELANIGENVPSPEAAEWLSPMHQTFACNI